MTNKVARPEHPNPQFKRDNWRNLNGEWDFEIDYSSSGFDKEYQKRKDFNNKINIPFCPESKLSGIENKDFMNCVWYGKYITINKDDIKLGRRITLHFGACDYESHIFVNQNLVGKHVGGYSSFCFDITDYVTIGENYVTVAAIDNTRSPLQGTGKQSATYQSIRCNYTRTTGIWQTVWIEIVEKKHIEEIKFFPDARNGRVLITGSASSSGKVEIAVSFLEENQGHSIIYSDTGRFSTEIELKDKHLWDIGNGNLYDVKIKFYDDIVYSYFGLRDISFDGMKFILNGKSVFQRLVLDQGYYPDGIYTAPDEDSLINDIKISMAAGFNGARLHQKVFEPLFLYHCDRLGYIVWGEYGDWGMDYSDSNSLLNFLPEWLEIIKRDFNHPSIVGWCPMNETWDYKGWKRPDPGFFKCLYYATKAADNTRPVIDTSGGYHVITDVFDYHDYEQDPQKFKEKYDKFDKERTLDISKRFLLRQKYDNQPFFISEYGGIKWGNIGNGWGYKSVENIQDFNNGYEGLTKVLLRNKSMFGFCYTQLYDVEQEENGLYYYDRNPKVDIKFIHKINSIKAAIED